MVKQIILVGTGGAIGSILRFLVSEFTHKYCSLSFPLATFAINLIGCFCIGLFVNLLPTGGNLRFLLIVGFCGGFTTFSAFARETLDLIALNQLPIAISYVVLSCVFGVLAVWVGVYLSK